MWLAKVDSRPAGCILLRPLSGTGKVEVKRLYVKDSFRRMGIANQLFEILESFARDNGAREIHLDSQHHLQAAVHLFKSRGYEEIERYNDSKVDYSNGIRLF